MHNTGSKCINNGHILQTNANTLALGYSAAAQGLTHLSKLEASLLSVLGERWRRILLGLGSEAGFLNAGAGTVSSKARRGWTAGV